jgi:hypothetical protein
MKNNSIIQPTRSGAIDKTSGTASGFPDFAFEHDGDGKESDPTLTLVDPWNLHIEGNLTTPKSYLTPEGGFAVLLTNKTGATSVKGNLVTSSDGTDNAVKLTIDEGIDPIGIIYNEGIADGSEVWIVVSGIADVLYGGNTTRGHFARVPVAADSYASGEAISEALPGSPHATDKHFQEIGHPLESRVGAGLAKTVLHFN